MYDDDAACLEKDDVLRYEVGVIVAMVLPYAISLEVPVDTQPVRPSMWLAA